MKKKIIGTFIISVLLMPSIILPKTFKIDSAHSRVEFTVPHLMISTVTGRFNKFQGSIKFQPQKRILSGVDVSIDTASIDTNQAKRDGHLRSADFFDVKKYPKITFKSNKKVRLRKGRVVRLPGKITIHGVTRRAVLKVTYRGKVKNLSGKMIYSFRATITINRKNFGLTWNKVLDTGGVAVGNRIKITITGELI